MARADLIKALFRSYKSGDDTGFLDAAMTIIEEERKKHHVVVANELLRILKNGSSNAVLRQRNPFESLPKDADRSMPLLEIRRANRYFEDLVLAEDQLEVLNSVVHEVNHWDILSANGLRPSSKLLFCGPPGCGKTVTAEAIASQVGLPLLYVRFDSVVSSLLGETASNLRKVFDYAERGSWVLLFDEFDTVGRSRDDPTEHGELKRVVNAFLQMLDGFHGRSLVIAVTNFEQSLDPAIWRRFDEIVRFDKPNQQQVLALLNKRLRYQTANNQSLRLIPQEFEGMSYAEVERVCLDILKHLALEGRRSIAEEDVLQAVKKQERRKQALLESRTDGPPAVDKD